MNALRLIIKIKYLQLYGRHLARMLVSLKAARLPECPFPACTASASVEAFRSGSPHRDSRRRVWKSKDLWVQWRVVVPDMPHHHSIALSGADQCLTGAAGTSVSPAGMFAFCRAVAPR